MKKITNFLLVMVAVITVSSVTAVVNAQKENQIASNSALKNIDYVLPYPGILPGNPLYSLKMIRDRIVSAMITSPLKKGEFNLLMADKRINAGLYLINYNKISLGEPTISKGQNYFDQSVEFLIQAKKEGINVVNFRDNMIKANLKHQEVLEEILLKVPDSAKPGIRNALERAKKSAQEISNTK